MTRVVHIFTVAQSLKFLAGQPGFLRARGYDVSVITSPDPALDQFGGVQGCQTVGVEMPRRITPLRDLLAVVELVKTLRRVKPTIVHAHTPKGGLLGMIAATAAGVPVRVYHMRGLAHMTASGLQRTLLRATETVSCSLAHRVICVSHSLRSVAVDEGLVDPARIVVLLGGSGQGVDCTTRFHPDAVAVEEVAAQRVALGIPTEAPVVGFVGRLVRDKGVGELSAAWQTLRVRFPDAHLVIVGPEEERDALDPQVLATLRADPRVHLLGFTENLPALYAMMRVLALPTYREGFPNVALEAAAMARPVVATQVPGCVDAVLDGVTGTLVPAADAPSLARAVGHYLADEAFATRRGLAGRARVVRDFRREAIWGAIADSYDELCTRMQVGDPTPVLA